jgi:hypothetical protein
LSRQQLALWVLIVPAFIGAGAVLPPNCLAEVPQITLQSDLEYIYSLVDTEDNETGDVVDSEFNFFRQKYNLELRNKIFPYLSFLGGARIELIDSRTDTEGLEAGFDQRTTRAYAELDLDNPLYSLGTAYRRREFKFDPINFDKLEISREEFSGLFKWRPVGLPLINLDFNRFHTWDDADTRDLTVDLLVLKGRYDYEDLLTDYTYTRSDQDEAVLDNQLLTQIHNGGVRYTREFFQDRVEATGAVRLNYQSLEPSGEGNIELPTTSPGAEFYLTDDSDPNTLTYVDATNPLTTINLGLNADPFDVGLGLDFAAPTEVDLIHVHPVEEREDLDLSVVDFFVWTVFTSDDQVNWVERTVSSASYSVFYNRWEISFQAVDTVFIKVVTTPIPTATSEIRIADLRAFTTVAGESGETIENITQTYNYGLRWDITDRTVTSYEGFFRQREDKFTDRTKTTITNGLSLQHDFSPMFYADARVLRTDTDESLRGKAVQHTYSASFTADWFPTLNQRLVYSGKHDDVRGLTGFSNSIILRTNADVYRDWGVNLDLGYTANNPVFGPNNTSASFRLNTNIAPNERMNFTIDFLGSWETETGRDSGFNYIGRFQAFWVPIPTFSVYANVNLRDQLRDQNAGLKVSQNYSVNWAPFPDGTLNFNLAYNQTIDTRDNQIRALTPEINWQITRTALLTLSFDYGTIETDTETRDLKVLRMRFRAYF